jgi:FkbM family methyltransferase
MQNHRGVWLPDGESHLIAWMDKKNQIVDGKPTYQYHKLQVALGYVPAAPRAVAVDVGAHCGLWTVHLLREFRTVHAFEPVAAHRECWFANVLEMSEHETFRSGIALMHPVALGDAPGSASMKTAPSSSGDTTIAEGTDVAVKTLDSYQLEACDFLKVDCEGYELPILVGAQQTLLAHKPVVIVEQKPGKAQQFGFRETEAVDYLMALGAKLYQELSGDYILGW